MSRSLGFAPHVRTNFDSPAKCDEKREKGEGQGVRCDQVLVTLVDLAPHVIGIQISEQDQTRTWLHDWHEGKIDLLFPLTDVAIFGKHRHNPHFRDNTRIIPPVWWWRKVQLGNTNSVICLSPRQHVTYRIPMRVPLCKSDKSAASLAHGC